VTIAAVIWAGQGSAVFGASRVDRQRCGAQGEAGWPTPTTTARWCKVGAGAGPRGLDGGRTASP